MKLSAMVLASAFALSSTCAFAQTVRHESNVLIEDNGVCGGAGVTFTGLYRRTK